MEEQTWRKTVGAILGELKPMRWRILALFAFTAIPVVLGQAQPLVVKWLIDSLVSAGHPSWEAVRLPFFVFAGLLLASWIGWRVANTIEVHVATRSRTTGVGRVFARLSMRSAGFFGDAQSGRLVHHVESFGNAIEQLLGMAVNQLMSTVIFVVSFTVALAFQSLWFAAGFLAWVIITTYVQYRVAATTREGRKVVTERRSEAGGLLADAVGNILTTKVFAREQEETKSVRGALDRFRVSFERAAMREEWLWGLQDALFFALQAALMYVVLRAWVDGRATVGDVVLVQSYLAMLFYFLSGQTRMFRQLPTLLSEAAPAANWLLEEPDIVDAPDAKPLKVSTGAIAFESIRFGYKNGRAVLKGFTLDIRPGEKVAFVGPSGAGKSTIVKLLYRFYDPDAGTISIDGQDISKMTQESLRRSLALVPQDPVLFHRSILENLRYANPKATMKEVTAAAKRAHCAEFIKDLPNGYDSLVGDRGVKLSGGERQRVALARAILADAPILVLDEATSSLDSASEALIKDALHEVMKGKTVLVIAHRLSTIMEMDRIVVMDHGKVIDQGTHAELIKREGKYKQLWDLQSGGYLPEVEE